MNSHTSDKRNYRYLIYLLFVLSGVSGLVYQIVWTRMLVLVFGNTMLATSTVLSAFMGGLAAGSYVLGKYIDKRPRSLLTVYAVLEAGIGLFTLIFPFVLEMVTPPRQSPRIFMRMLTQPCSLKFWGIMQKRPRFGSRPTKSVATERSTTCTPAG